MILCFIKTNDDRSEGNDDDNDNDTELRRCSAVTAVRALDIYKLFVFCNENHGTEHGKL